MSRRSEIEDAIFAEVEKWPDAKVEIEQGKGHPKARLEFGGLIMRRTFPGTPGDKRSVIKTLADIRRTLRQMGAQRGTEATETEDDEVAEKVYRKPPVQRREPDPPPPPEPESREPMADQLAEHPAAKAKPPAKFEREFGEGGEVSEVADEPRVDPAQREREIKAAAALIEDGIYFDLPEDVYHAVERASTSGLQKMCVSPADFWRESWLNPKPPTLDEEQLKRKEKTRALGRAYHCARLEPAAFAERYYRKPAKLDYLGIFGVIWNGTQAGDALADYGETKKRSSESVVEQCERLEDCGYPHPIWPLIEARAAREARGKVGIDGIDWDSIATDMERLIGNKDIADLLSDGQPEVSIFWTDRNGIKMKCRVDWLATGWWDDFKTFDNPYGKVLKQALNDALRFNRYHIQAVIYREGIEAIRVDGLQIKGEATDAQRALIAAIQIRPDELACWYIFQQKGGVPNLLAKRFPFFAVDALTEAELQIFIDDEGRREELRELRGRKTGLHIRAIQDIDQAKRDFMLYSQVYPAGVPWAPINARGAFDDFDFNRYWLEGTQG